MTKSANMVLIIINYLLFDYVRKNVLMYTFCVFLLFQNGSEKFYAY